MHSAPYIENVQIQILNDWLSLNDQLAPQPPSEDSMHNMHINHWKAMVFT
jgi:hypothetical protein